MQSSVKLQPLTNSQLNILSFQTCQWWNAVIIQAKRFLDALSSNKGGTPWEEDETNSIFVADRLFLVIAIHHAIEDLQKLNIELLRKNDKALEKVLASIDDAVPLQDIRNLRDMNIHNLDYLVGKGFKQDSFKSEVDDGKHKIITTAAWTYSNGDTKSIYVGKVHLDKLLRIMQEQLPIVRTKTEQVFMETLWGERKDNALSQYTSGNEGK